MTNVGKLLIVAGLLVAVVGLVVWGLGRAGFRGLPGDIRYESGNVRFYFPIVTCIVLSVSHRFDVARQWLAAADPCTALPGAQALKKPEVGEHTFGAVQSCSASSGRRANVAGAHGEVLRHAAVPAAVEVAIQYGG